MAYDLTGRLVIGVASSALFDLTDSDATFRDHGEEGYRRYQEEHVDDPLAPGVAFPFIKKLLALNDLADPDSPLVEVIVLSRNSADTGLRVMRSIAHHDLPIIRAVFTQGRAPYVFVPALNMSLFLSADEASVRDAVTLGLPAGQVLPSAAADDDGDELRVAFDFDGVLASDEAERIFQTAGLAGFHANEVDKITTPLTTGPLHAFAVGIQRIQAREEDRVRTDPDYIRRVRVAVVTARSAPAHERALATLKSWGVTVNDAFFLGGIDKGAILETLRPHIFFDDQTAHLNSTRRAAPSVHVPYGAINSRRPVQLAAQPTTTPQPVPS